LAIGWHFANEGLKHWKDPKWSGANLLRTAKGPWADKFKAFVPNLSGFEQLLSGEDNFPLPPGAGSGVAEGEALDKLAEFQKLFNGYDSLPEADKQSATNCVKWWQRLEADWQAYANQFGDYYSLTDEQRHQVALSTKEHLQQVWEWLATNREAIATHTSEAHRWEGKAEEPSAKNVDFQKQRLGENNTKLAGETTGWWNAIRGMEESFHDDLRLQLSGDQKQKPIFPGDLSPMKKVDLVLKWGIPIVGICLLAGVFTRLAALLGAGFLASICLQQPFWVEGAAETYYQLVELAGLLVLFTTPAGRWLGLDGIPRLLWRALFGKPAAPKNQPAPRK
jgi:uncharacterized membrane protein YphA (DoxX/SURF4 family)